MFKRILTACLALATTAALATSDPVDAFDPLETTFYKNTGKVWDYHTQQVLRQQPAWQSYVQSHEGWNVQFNESNNKPHRAYGPALPTSGDNALSRALHFIETDLSGFGLPTSELVFQSAPVAKDLTYIHFNQVHQGLEVLNASMVVKLWNDQAIMWGADLYTITDLNTTAAVDLLTAEFIASADMVNTIVTVETAPELAIIAVPEEGSADFRLVYQILVNTENDNGVPANYYTLVDAHTGNILYRQNRVQHFASCDMCAASLPTKNGDPKKEVRSMGMMAIDGNVHATVHPHSPFDDTEVIGLPYVQVTTGGDTFNTDFNGDFSSGASGPTTGSFSLEGPWSTVYTNDNQPQFSTTLMEGDNAVSYDADASIRELSAYLNTNIVHDYVNQVLPDFTGMDFSITTNIDVAGECNAFYNGSINFYNLAGGCNATSLISDVVYHEYGHGVNNTFYQSQGGFFSNGAMNEGYADVWAISITDNPHLGQGFYTDTTDGIRRYDQDPKVYPQDIVNEVHGDGEIICGAWYDTHLLMGADWTQTMELFAAAYPGLQAEAFNGNEGQAFTDVLLDALQADDDDGDITNGTVNGYEIVEGFYIHGITLLASADFEHSPLYAHDEEQTIEISASINVPFPFTEYLEEGTLFYSVNAGPAQEAALVNTTGDTYVAEIPGQPMGSVVEYYVGLYDIFDQLAATKPIGAAIEDNNIRYFVIVGMATVETHDGDQTEDWGEWDTGVPGDIATTGQWEINIPIGSFDDPTDFSTVVAPYYEHTGGEFGELCFLTGQSANFDDGVGANDVDGGHTTLRSPIIDLTDYDTPVMSYWRWYVNAPATGANPGQDWWQVQISDDGGSSWMFLEETRTQDISWRRNAFRVEDYLEVNDQFRIQMVVSDSIWEGLNLNGGSLIEAAVDDIFLWDLDIVSVEEQEAALPQWSIYPNPSDQSVHLNFEFNASSNVEVEVINALGQVVLRETWAHLSAGRQTFSTSELESGMYQVRVTHEGIESVQQLSVIHR